METLSVLREIGLLIPSSFPRLLRPGGIRSVVAESVRVKQQLLIALAFDVSIDNDLVQRVLSTPYRPKPDFGDPFWLTFLGHMRKSLWSIDLFSCESVTLRTHWILVAMDQFTRVIFRFGVFAGTVDGIALCRMFNHAIRGHWSMPKYLSSDDDPLYRFAQWQANLRNLEVIEAPEKSEWAHWKWILVWRRGADWRFRNSAFEGRYLHRSQGPCLVLDAFGTSP